MSKPFAKEPKDLLALQPPAPLKEEKTKNLVYAASHYLERWRWIVSSCAEVSQLECPFFCPHCGKETKYSGVSLWHRLSLVSGAYYESAVRELFVRSLDGKPELPPGLNINALDLFAKQLGATVPDYVRLGHQVQVRYGLALLGAYFISPLRRMPVGPIQPFEESAHNGLVELNNLRNHSKNQDFRRLMYTLSSGLIEILGAIYSQPYPTWNSDHKLGPFSAIRLPELALLARRDEVLSKRYGAKNVETIYEQQLALIMQSFGFVVVRTRKGDRTVDLVCISSDPNNSMTILVEAKTTKHTYTLPTDDQRALVEYVREVRQNLTTLPPLSLVLIVAPSASASMESRLSNLESDAGVPMRLISAGDFAQLREAIAGPLRLPVFRTAALASPTKVLHGIASIVAADSKAVTDAHQTLVRAYLPGAVHSGGSQHEWGHEHSHDKAGQNGNG